MVLDSFYLYIDGGQEQLRASHPGQGYWEFPGSLSVAHSLALYLDLLKNPGAGWLQHGGPSQTQLY